MVRRTCDASRESVYAELLPISAEDVPIELSEAVASLCAAAAVLRAAYPGAHHPMTQVVSAITTEHEAFWEMALGMMPNMGRLMPLSPITSGSA